MNEELFDNYITDRLSREEAENLKTLLESDAKAQEAFVAHLMEWELMGYVARQFLLKGSVQNNTKALRVAAESARRRRKHKHSKSVSWLRFLVIPVAAAAAFMLFFHLFNLSTSKNGQTALVAEIIGLSGTVDLVRQGASAPARVGTRVLLGDELKTGAAGRATLSYPDGTALNLAIETAARLEIHNGAKQVYLNAGKLNATVAEQPAGKPMLFTTPFGEACVLGTQLSIEIERQAARLEVTKGTVRLTNTDKKSVDVEGGNYAMAAAGAELSAKPIAAAVVKAAPAISTAAGEAPYGNNGHPWPIPGLIFTSDYDAGGEGVGHHSVEKKNPFGDYGREDGVGKLPCNDEPNNGWCVGVVAAGQWLNYTVNIAAAGDYTVTFRTSSGFAGGPLHLELDGATLTGKLDMPPTGSWQAWISSPPFNVHLPAGRHILRIVEDGVQYGLNWMKFEAVAKPFSGPLPSATKPNSASAPDK